jgi:hypothetical protein
MLREAIRAEKRRMLARVSGESGSQRERFSERLRPPLAQAKHPLRLARLRLPQAKSDLQPPCFRARS